MATEKIIRLREGEEAPEGWRVVRVVATELEQEGTGANFVHVYIVVVTTALIITSDVIPDSHRGRCDKCGGDFAGGYRGCQCD